MVGRPKKEDHEIFSEPVVREVEYPVVEPKVESVVHVAGPVSNAGLKVQRIEGFLVDVKKTIESLPVGEVPVEFTYENQNFRPLGRAVFLLVTKTDSSSKLKCQVIDAMGLEKLNDQLQKLDLTKLVDMFIVPAQINKHNKMQQYLAILVGE